MDHTQQMFHDASQLMTPWQAHAQAASAALCSCCLYCLFDARQGRPDVAASLRRCLWISQIVHLT